MATVRVEHGDSRDVLRSLADASVHACVCDPPYSLVSIQKRFGKAGSAPAKEGTDGLYRRASAGFMGQQWDTGETAHDPEFWREVLRVLKPGAHLVAFAGTRTYHRMACAIEDAGFEVRDQIGWAFGSGFPKSHSVGKAIDRAAGVSRRVISEGKPVKRMIPGADQDRTGSWVKDNGRVYVPSESEPATDAAAQWDGWGTALKPAWEPICLARKPLIGTVAENVLQFRTGAINIDGCRVGNEAQHNAPVGAHRNAMMPYEGKDGPGTDVIGRWPANVIHDGGDEVIAAFPKAPGQQRAVGPQHGAKPSVNVYGDYGAREQFEPRGDAGSAARFFYAAKADADDRCDSKHPTVKPVALMRWLARLVTPPNGLVLDPFAGSGTTGVACLREGFDCILIEREARYVADIRHRLAKLRGLASPLFAGAAP